MARAHWGVSNRGRERAPEREGLASRPLRRPKARSNASPIPSDPRRPLSHGPAVFGVFLGDLKFLDQYLVAYL